MLSDAKIDEVQDLLREGAMSARAIAFHCRVSRDSVQRIRSGKRQPRRTPPVERDPQAAYERCGCCGGMVQKPCLICRALAAGGERGGMVAALRQQIAAGQSDPLGLDLKPQHQARYEPIHQRRVAEERQAEPFFPVYEQVDEDDAEFFADPDLPLDH